MSAAIYFHPEAYTTGGPSLMGRNAAGESFLRGFLAHSRASEFWVQTARRAHAEHFASVARTFGRREPVRVVDRAALGALSEPGAVYHPGPGLARHARERSLYGAANWSLCGITHTTASVGAMDSVAELITAPVQPWDALICTSLAVKNNVERVLQAQVDLLQQRLDIRKVVLPQLPVIPLGVHTQDFAFTADRKAKAREALGADPNTHVVLFVGRLSFHAKAHPLAMYQALQSAAGALPAGQKVLLVECGWHANDAIAKSYAEAAALACPDVNVVTLDGRDAGHRLMAWAAADIFCSLSDNIQETFGITPIEAMAAGLPVVVSDWDGYKDTVRDGVDGFRVPTLMAADGLGTDLALRHALEIDTYDMYCGHVCTMVAVDVPATARAFGQLFASPELRRRMGEAGRERARAVYEWAAIIPQYEALWDELGALRREGADVQPLRRPWPARLDPFHGFAAYPTRTLAADMRLQLEGSDLQQAITRVERYRQLTMVGFAEAILPSSDEVRTVLAAAAAGPSAALGLVASVPAPRQPLVFRSLVWLLKLGVLRPCE